jgi:hypothetical protein
VLQIAPSAYHAHAAQRTDPAKASPRTRQDLVLVEQIRRVQKCPVWSASGEKAGALVGLIGARRDAGLRRFWAAAARRNSSLAPHGPCRRSRSDPGKRLSCLLPNRPLVHRGRALRQEDRIREAASPQNCLSQENGWKADMSGSRSCPATAFNSSTRFCSWEMSNTWPRSRRHCEREQSTHYRELEAPGR